MSERDDRPNSGGSDRTHAGEGVSEPAEENGGAEPAASEMGEPISELSLLELTPTTGFVSRVRHRIERRRLGAHATAFVWNAPLLILVSLIEMLTGLVGVSANGPTSSSSRADGEEGS